MQINNEILKHIEAECSFILVSIKHYSFDDFYNDDSLKRAVSRALNIISNCLKKLSLDFKSSHPEIEWEKLINSLNGLFMDFLNIDYKNVWKTINDDIPHLNYIFIQK